ncbi:C4b-binding protein alpha chain-like isoform X2 [Phyllobates terribilis]|uniref:C4b-binding protein alpha chain-like isoform X2 n=1 Tax=Phyllobates terribilis TaxID=111132 RepID=UPI003CCB1F3D
MRCEKEQWAGSVRLEPVTSFSCVQFRVLWSNRCVWRGADCGAASGFTKMSPVWYTAGRIWTVLLIFLSQINCIRGDCGPPPVIPHTQPVTETSGVPGDTVVYVCDRNSGYYDIPDHEKTITCNDDNTWSSVPEFCARACGVPDRLNFAVPKEKDLSKDIFLPGTKISYDCRPGYRRVPGSDYSVTCLDNLSWSAPSDFCTLRECGHPEDIHNGYFEVSNMFFFGSRVTYNCNEGYRLLSKTNYRDCQANGQWSNVPPDCEATICPAPDKPTDGTYDPEKDEYTYLDAVTFKCNKGLHVIGTSSASCTSNGTWSGGSPTCKAVSCPDPAQVQNGRRVSGFVGPYTLNSAVRYECEDNFVIKGSSSITCTVDSQWSHEIPKCLTVCAAPPISTYAELEESFTNLIYFDQITVLYKCKPGYIRDPEEVNQNQITCLGRSWSKLAKFCSPISCGDPGKVTNANKIGSEFTFGHRVRYTCQDGYHITSSTNYKECQVDGNWSSGEIICSVKCQSPNVDNSLLRSPMKSVYVHGDSVEFDCKKNFVLLGSRLSTCNSHGQWDPSHPKCKATCQITEIANTKLKVDFERVYMEDEILVIECIEGYVLSGSGTITCSSQGQWTPSITVCKAVMKGIGTGAIVGIVIGCLAVVILVIVCCCCCLKNKSGKPKSETPDVHYTACNDA